VSVADGVTSLDARGDQLFLLSHKNAPTFQVLQPARRAIPWRRPRSSCPPGLTG
jgi:hypothetical protein